MTGTSKEDPSAATCEQTSLLRRQKLDALTMMAMSVAHDYSNYLAVVLGNAAVAARGLADDAPAKQNLKQIEDAARQAMELTGKIRSYTGQDIPKRTAIDLAEWVSGLRDAVASDLPAGMSLSLEAEPGLPPLQADTARVQQALMVLVANAADAMRDRPGPILIRCGATNTRASAAPDLRPETPVPSGDYVFLEVVDRGEGMCESVRERMFDPFYTTRFRAPGLGLAAVLGIMRSHGGGITVRSAPGEGATIRLLFPVTSTPEEG